MKSKKTAFTRVKEIAAQVIFCLLLALMLTAAIFLVTRGRNKQPIFVLGRSFLWVETGSMKPTIDERSYVMVRAADGEKAEVGDIIVFVCPDPESPVYGSLIIHRVFEVTADGYRTKGDNEMSTVDTWTVPFDGIVAVWEKNLGAMTFFGRFFASPIGFVLLCALFFAVCSFVYLPSIIKTLRNDAQESADAEHKAEIERRIRLEVERLEKISSEKASSQKYQKDLSENSPAEKSSYSKVSEVSEGFRNSGKSENSESSEAPEDSREK